MRDHLRPLYAKRFKCIGSACEDNCCHGWDVSIDQAAYEKYKAIPALENDLERLLVINNGSDNASYAFFKLQPSCRCPMQLEDGLCRIHREFGEDYLPKTCATYPRATKRIDGLPEHALVLSCPEAARVVLLEPQLLTPNGSPASGNKYSRLIALGDEAISTLDKPMRYFWEGREFSMALVQDRRYPLWQRLFLLGMFCKRLDAVVVDPRPGSVSNLLREYAEIAAEGKLRSAMEAIPARPEAQLRMVLQVVDFHLSSQDPRFSRFRECLRDFLSGVGHTDSAQKVDRDARKVAVTLRLETCLRHYVQAHERYYAPFMDRHPYLLENYLINHIIRLGFPFRFDVQGQRISPQQQFLLMCVEFALIKALLIGMAGHYKESFATDHVVKLVQVVAKSVEHSANFLGALNWQDLANTNSWAALLRN
jgi:lysine-N-methylase